MSIVVLEGDGIGPGVIEAALMVLRAVGFEGPFVEAPFGYQCWLATGSAVPEQTVKAIREAGVALLGAGTTPQEGCESPILELRSRLGLDILVRPAWSERMDLVVVGHAFEGLYGSREHPGPPAVIEWIVSEEGASRLMAEAFARARRKVTLVDKPTVLRGAFEIFRRAAERHQRTGIEFEAMNADRFVAALLRRPEDFDVIAATSLISDIVSDLSAELMGGIGCAPSMSVGDRVALFEPVHGSAPHRAAERPLSVNPMGAILAAAMMLEHLGESRRAERIRQAVRSSSVKTPDLGGSSSTAEVARAVAETAARL